MLLTALEIQGFKSFPDKTKVTIGKGITAIVGPNGSGKSNISDAVRWVMGETSAKQLRGGGKMENVIFGGTQLRGAMGYAMVNLHVDNSDKRLEVDSDTVVIGRKYYRSGDSEYSINGQHVRLKDIYEMLLDTGLGRDGYSVIGQGRIAEIVGAKSADRREIFEEASGISKFRYRKNEAERRLNTAEDNLVRLRDILTELEQRVGPLERESRKAKMFIELAEQKKGLEVTLWVDTAERAKETLRELLRKAEIAQADYDAIEKKISECDTQTQVLWEEQERCIVESNRLQNEITSVNESIAGADTRIAVLRNNILHNEEAVRNMTSEKKDRETFKLSIQSDIEQQEELIKKSEQNILVLEQSAQELTQMLTKLQSENVKSGERRGAITQALAQMTTEITELKVSEAASTGAVETAKQRLETVEADGLSNNEILSGLTQEKADTDDFLNATEESLTRLENIKNGISLKLQARQKTLEDSQQNEQNTKREIDNCEHRIQVLKDLQQSMQGYQDSVKTVMNAYKNKRLKGILGPVASVLSVKPGYEVAVETALGFALQNIIVENESAAKAAMSMLKSERAGRATFLPLDTMRPSYFDKKLQGSAVQASSLVQFDEKYKTIVSNLLGRVVVVDDINEASAVAKSLDYKNRIVTKDGQIINAGGSFTGGSVSKTSGVFTRRQEIDELTQKASALNKKLNEIMAETDEVKAEVDALSAQVVATDSEIITAGGDKIRCETELSRLDMSIAQAQSTKKMLDEERAVLNERVLIEDENAQKCVLKLQLLTQQCQSMETELTSISGDDDTFVDTRARLSDEISEVKLKILASQKDIENYSSAIAALNARTGDDDERNKQLDESIASMQEKNKEYEMSIEEIEGLAVTSKEKVAEIRKKIDVLSETRMQKEGEARVKTQHSKQLAQDREGVSREIARLVEQKQTKDAEYEQTLAKLWEDYELTPSSAQEMCVEFESIAALKAEVMQVRNKIKNLGNVNLGAIEEYEQVSQRYEFMRDQVNDVEQSKKELLELISTLSDDMRAMFLQSFASINNNFQHIFKELFGGGFAKLSLDEGADVLESGINIEVAPPGKIIKNLSSLSGGEQALVAISIYFAILAVNPAPFCVLDEIEAALDDVNVTRFARFLRRISDNTQFIVITHRRGTMEEADVLYGVTMQEDGVSKLLKLDVENVDVSLVS